jgi:hypothetical protein
MPARRPSQSSEPYGLAPLNTPRYFRTSLIKWTRYGTAIPEVQLGGEHLTGGAPAKRPGGPARQSRRIPRLRRSQASGDTDPSTHAPKTLIRATDAKKRPSAANADRHAWAADRGE